MTGRGNILRFPGLLAIAAAGMIGCSSLPSSAPENSALQRRAAAFQATGLGYYRDGRYEQAATFFKRALAIHGSVDDRPGVAEALVNLGRVRLALGELDEAEASFKRARDAVVGIDRPELEAQALGGLGAAALHRRLPGEAAAWLEAALALPLADPGPERAVLLHDLGAARSMEGDLEAARSSLQRALAMHETLADALGVATDCHALATHWVDAGDLVRARDFAQRALDSDKAVENPVGVAQDLTLLGTLAARAGAAPEAAGYYRRAILAWESLDRRAEIDAVNTLLRALPEPAP